MAARLCIGLGTSRASLYRRRNLDHLLTFVARDGVLITKPVVKLFGRKRL